VKVRIVPVLTPANFYCAENSPWKTGRKSYEAYDNWGKYMEEMIVTKKRVLRSRDNQSSSVDIIGQLIKGQDEQNTSKLPDSTPLTDDEVMGNLFLFIQAGHETSASSIHLSILLLALHPQVQREVQQELDEIFQGRSISKWDYETDLPRLLNGKLGAVMNEQLRLLAPVLTIPKVVCPEPQQVFVDGKVVTLPANTTIRLCSPSVHVNPKFWPHGPPKNPDKPVFPLDNLDNDLEEFKPDRWVKPGIRTSSPNGSPNVRTRSSKLSPEREFLHYIPVKGSYLPFSDGQRICLGRRFAQVEVLAALATIFSQYSVELDVSELASDEDLLRMTKGKRREVWQKVEEKAQWEWRNKVTCIITVQLTRDAHVPLRFVKRGRERFFDL
jgi:cytochrome P450